MGLFNNNSVDISVGDHVLIKYMGVEGVVADIDGNYCIVSYINEHDYEVVETFNISDLMKY